MEVLLSLQILLIPRDTEAAPDFPHWSSVLLKKSLNLNISLSFLLGKASSLSKGLQNISLVQGEDAVFTCEVTQSSSKVKWAKDGKSIKKSQKYEISQQEKVMKLNIHSVSAEDSGEYSCEVIGGATTKARLEIKGKHDT